MGYRNPTGFPSVTQCLSYHLETEFFTEESRDRGRAVHAAASAYLQGLFVSSLPERWQGYFDSFRRWSDLMIDRVVIVERRLADPVLGISGQPDAVIILRGDTGNTLADWKTSIAAQKWWRLQIAGYRRLTRDGYYTDDDGKLTERANIETKRGGSVQLFADGRTGKWHEYTETYKQDFNTFLSVLNSFNFFDGGN